MHESVAPNTVSQFRLEGSSPFVPILPFGKAEGKGIWPSHRMKAMLRAGARIDRFVTSGSCLQLLVGMMMMQGEMVKGGRMNFR